MPASEPIAGQLETSTAQGLQSLGAFETRTHLAVEKTGTPMSMIHDITAVTPRNKKRTRKGRGEASKGKTSGRGGKGASARGGGPYWKRGHEGGQTSIFRRFPKRGFSNHDFA